MIKNGFINLVSFLLTIGLAVLGWVAADVPALVQDPIAAVCGFFNTPWGIVFVILTFIECFLAALLSPLSGTPKDEMNSRWTYWRGTILETVIVLSIFCDRKNLVVMGQTDLIRYAGIGLICLSIFISTWSGSLRKKQIMEETENSFLTKGPNRWIRYPEHLATILEYLGIAGLFHSWAGIFLFFMLVVSLMRYSLLQDRLKTMKYQMQWVKYQHRTKRIFPFVY